MFGNNSTILITGAAGFIGGGISNRLLYDGKNVLGLDYLNSYYSSSLEKDLLNNIEHKNDPKNSSWKIFECDLCDNSAIFEIFKEFKPLIVINLAAQAGVRYSTENTNGYIQSNLVRFSNLIEQSKNFSVI